MVEKGCKGKGMVDSGGAEGTSCRGGRQTASSGEKMWCMARARGESCCSSATA